MNDQAEDAKIEPKIEEPIVTNVSVERVKKTRTPAQLQTLALAREKAVIIRAQNTEMRRKEKLVDRAAAEEVKRLKVDRLEKQYNALNKEAISEPPDVEKSPDEVPIVKKHKKKRVIVVEESSSEEEIEIRLPKAKKGKERPVEMDPSQVRYQKLYNKMFALD